LTFPAHVSVASDIIAKWRRFSFKHDKLELFNLLQLLDKELDDQNFNSSDLFFTISTHVLKDKAPKDTGLNHTCKTSSAKLMSPCWQVFKSRRPWKLKGPETIRKLLEKDQAEDAREFD